MQVIDILQETAEIMNLIQIKDELKNVTKETESETLNNTEIQSLMNLLKLSVRELCSNYVPAVRCENVNILDGEYKLSELKNYIKIKSIKKEGQIVSYKILNRNIKVIENGNYEVEYYSYPEINSLFDEIEFLKNLNSEVIIFGLCSYYALSKGMFEDFHEMHDMYVQHAESLKELKLFTMPQRSWE